MAERPTILSLKSVRKIFGTLAAVDSIDLDIAEGEFFTIVGPSGSGKTTLLRLIAGMEQPTSGDILLRGERINDLPSYAIVGLGISHVPQGGRIFPDMNVRENLEMGSYPIHAWKQRTETFEQVYQLFPRLQERQNQLARTLSGGEHQMLAIGRALMSKPTLCIFDEPSYGLAPLLVKEMFQIIQNLREQGITILLIEQNVRRALEIADRAYVLENGRLCLEGDCV
jgi:branched-chain amino acid transport system ATP-binding protein